MADTYTYPVTGPDGTTRNIEASSPQEAMRKAYTEDQMNARQAKGEPNLGDYIRQGQYGQAAGRVGQMLKESATSLPGRVLENFTPTVSTEKGYPTVEGPKMRTALPLSIGLPPGAAVGASGIVLPALARLTGIGGGAVIDEPKPTLAGNYETAFKAVAGDTKDPLSVLTSPLAMETVGAGVSLGGRAVGQRAAQRNFARDVGQNLETATRGIIRAPQTPAELDALVRGAQDPVTGRVTSGKQTLGDFYGARVRDADAAIGNRPINVPTISNTPIPLEQAVRDAQEIAAGQTGKNPLSRTAQGRADRRLRQQAWAEIEGEVNRLDPSGDAWTAISNARSTFSVGSKYLEAIEKSGALKPGPNEVGWDSAKLQNYVSKNRAKFIEAFANDGNPEGYREFLDVVYHGGPVGSRDVLSGVASPADAVRQMLRSGGGAGTLAAMPLRTLAPGLGTQYTGTAPFTVPGGSPAMTLSDILAPRFGVDLRRGGPQ